MTLSLQFKVIILMEFKMPRLLEEPHGQYNPTEEKQKSAEAAKKREAEEAKKRRESWEKMVSYIK